MRYQLVRMTMAPNGVSADRVLIDTHLRDIAWAQFIAYKADTSACQVLQLREILSHPSQYRTIATYSFPKAPAPPLAECSIEIWPATSTQWAWRLVDKGNGHPCGPTNTEKSSLRAFAAATEALSARAA